MEAEIAGYEAKLAQLQEEERKELLQRVNATEAAEQIQSLRTTTDPLMRTKLQSQIRSLVAEIVVHLPARKITMRYLVQADTCEQRSRIIFTKRGKSSTMDMNRDTMPA